MTKKLVLTLSILALFASCGTRRGNNTRQNANTFDEGVVINGIRWATRNVDAPGTFAETPESFGMLFQWNRRKGWSATDENVENWDNSIPEGTEWVRRNDPCPRGWRIPTREELISLRDEDYGWTNQNGVYGRLFGTVPNQIFLPATGLRNAESGVFVNRIRQIGRTGYYWSSSIVENNAGFLWFERGESYNSIRRRIENNELYEDEFFFRESVQVSSGRRTIGFAIRCVAIN